MLLRKYDDRLQGGAECKLEHGTQGFLTPLGDEDDMIRTMPAGIDRALLGFRHGVFCGWAQQATRGARYYRHAQSRANHTGQTSGLPQIPSYSAVRGRAGAARPHSCCVASWAPSASACSFAQATVGCTRGWARTPVEKPQSVPAITFSLPTSSA